MWKITAQESYKFAIAYPKVIFIDYIFVPLVTLRIHHFNNTKTDLRTIPQQTKEKFMKESLVQAFSIVQHPVFR